MVGRPRLITLELARRHKRMSQNELSEKTRIGTWFISLIEQGRCIPSDDQARRLAAALEIPLETLLEPAPEPQWADRG